MAEPWHPNVTARPRVLAKLKAAERSLQRAISAYFAHQRAWVKQVWPAMLPADQVPPDAITDLGRQLEEHSQALAQVMAKGRKAALLLGGETAKRELAAKRASEFADPELGVDWSLDSPEAQEFIDQYGLDLARGLNRTTVTNVRGALVGGLKEGLARDDLATLVSDAAGGMPEWRAGLIAQTETIRAYTQGSLQVYDRAGVEAKQWLDGQAGACDECEALDGEVVPLGETFSSGDDGPPLHPGCRCTVAAAEAGEGGVK